MKNYIYIKWSAFKRYLWFLKKTFMTVRPLNEVQSHTSLWYAKSFRIVRTVRNAFVVAFFLGTCYGSAYVGFQVAEEWYPKTAKADTVTVEVPAEQKLSDYPILVRICNAESSGGHQFNKNGDVLRNQVTPSDIGICQIHETIWNDKARKLGYDIYTEKGNEDMAIWIFIHYGTDPWNSSKNIANGWGK